MRGAPGVGKTALLAYFAERARGCRVLQVTGVQSEMEMAFAGLHQLTAPLLDGLERLPAPQRGALETALGLSAGTPPDRFFIGLAVLSLLSDAAEERPLVCVIDDAQWLDEASAQVLAFVARRVQAESVAVLLATRRAPESDEGSGPPELRLEGLEHPDALELLASVIPGRLDGRVADRIVAESQGNPLALLELSRDWSAAELAGGFGLPTAVPLAGRIEERFRQRIETLPPATQRLLLVAAADAVGDPILVWRAAALLDTGAAAVDQADGLLQVGARVRFRHPLVRSAVYQAASPDERRRAHRALADASDPEVDPDRRAWHRAHAAPEPDEEVAAELERSAGRAQARGGLAAAAAFLDHARRLTPDPARRAERALAAAQAKLGAGAFDAALALLATTEAGSPDEFQRARIKLLRAQIAFAVQHSGDAPALLVDAGRTLEPLDADLARETYRQAISAAFFAERLASGTGFAEIGRAARAAPPSSRPARPADLLLDGLAVLLTEGEVAATSLLQRALRAFADERVSPQQLAWLWLAAITATSVWDDETWFAMAARRLGIVREGGVLSELPTALNSRVFVHVFAGELDQAGTMVEEIEALDEVTGSKLAPYGALVLAAWRGREAEVEQLIEANMREMVARGEGVAVTTAWWARAVLYNGLGRHEDALHAAQQASDVPHRLASTGKWSFAELVEAAALSGDTHAAANALERLRATTRASGTDWGLGIEARSRALLSDGPAAERAYHEAIERLARTRMRVELARAHLLYGEWLRREHRRPDARKQLRTAHEQLTAMGVEAFADRASRGLRALGETTRKRPAETPGQLTPQEAQIARLARDGLSNAEIGARLFISPRTAEYHLQRSSPSSTSAPEPSSTAPSPAIPHRQAGRREARP